MAKPEILYVDDSVAVCIKLAGTDAQDAMCALLREALGGEIYCVHRLDRGVGGVMVYARSAAAAAALSRAITDGRMQKEYLAICAGKPEPARGEMRDLLYHDAQRNKTYVVDRQRKGVREALLEYQVLSSDADASLIRVRLHTGRSHQIRVQFASRKMPLLGDRKYGSRERDCSIALWSTALSFPHPVNGELMRFSAYPPHVDPWTRFETAGDVNA